MKSGIQELEESVLNTVVMANELLRGQYSEEFIKGVEGVLVVGVDYLHGRGKRVPDPVLQTYLSLCAGGVR